MYQFKRVKEPPCHQAFLQPPQSIMTDKFVWEEIINIKEVSNGWLISTLKGEYIEGHDFVLMNKEKLREIPIYAAPKHIKERYNGIPWGWFSYFPLSLELDITSQCNFKCLHCNRSASPIRDQELGMKIINDLAEEVESIGLRRVQILGGEPMCHSSFKTICEIFHDHGATEMFTSTNGWLVNDATIGVFVDNFKDVQVSLHSIHAHTHDYISQHVGAWERAVNAIKILAQSGINVIVSMTVMHSNLHEMESLAILSERMGASTVRFLALQNIGRGKVLDSLSPTELEQGASTISHLSSVGHRLRILSMGFPVKNEFLNGSFWGCAAGRRLLYVKSNGDATCCSIVDTPAGSIQKSSLMDIWHNQHFRNIRKMLNQSCPLSKYCGGICKSEKDNPYASFC